MNFCFIDDDDKTFIDFNLEKYTDFNLKIITGKRLGVSVAHNFLYSQSSGQIVVTAADDFAFRTKGWDTLVREAFIKSKDNLILVYGNDMGSYGENMAIYSFFIVAGLTQSLIVLSLHVKVFTIFGHLKLQKESIVWNIYPN